MNKFDNSSTNKSTAITEEKIYNIHTMTYAAYTTEDTDPTDMATLPKNCCVAKNAKQLPFDDEESRTQRVPHTK